MTDFAEVLGRFSPEEWDAALARFDAETPSSQGWEVRVGDLTLDESELTVEQAIAISRLAGGGWETLNPLHSPAACAAIVVAVLVTKGGHSDESAAAAVDSMSAAGLLACVIRGA